MHKLLRAKAATKNVKTLCKEVKDMQNTLVHDLREFKIIRYAQKSTLDSKMNEKINSLHQNRIENVLKNLP